VEALRRAVEAVEFRTGLVAGLIATAAVCWTARRPRWADRRPVSLAGVAFAGSALVALDRARPFGRLASVPAGLVFAVGSLAAAGAISRLLFRRGAPRFALAVTMSVPGAWLIAAHAGLSGPSWMRATVLVAAAVGGPLVADFDRRHAVLGAGPVLLLLTVGGVYAAVPDTEAALVLLGVAVPVALLGFPVPVAALGNAGSHAVVGVVLWAVALGATGRPAAVVGALGAFGLLFAQPLSRVLPGPPLAALARQGRAFVLGTIVAAHLVFVFYAAEVVGPQRSVRDAVVLLAPAAAGALLVGWLLAPFERRTLPSSER
jgi:hypothetical protein